MRIEAPEIDEWFSRLGAGGEALVAVGGQGFAEAPAAAHRQLKDFRRAAEQAQSARRSMIRVVGELLDQAGGKA